MPWLPDKDASAKATEEFVRLSFHGAARGVTGSCHMVEWRDRRILVDCGLLQGGRELAEENAAPFGFDAEKIDYLLLTHAHLDHCGRLPLLVKRGFRGEVITTAASRELARLVMLDAAHLQAEEASRHEHQRRNPAAGAPRLYDVADAVRGLDRFGRVAEYGRPLAVAPGLRATFCDAGHILGSASILLELGEPGQSRSILFSGDIGNDGRPLLRPPTPPDRADIIVMESTYGDRRHRPFSESLDELHRSITDAFARGGNVIIPTFALERAQEILYVLNRGVAAKRLPAAVQVFLDSPLAISATEIFAQHAECFDTPTRQLFSAGEDPFGLPGLHLVRDAMDSRAINRIAGGAIIMAGSGMATGGRVRHHLRHNLPRRQSAIVFVGFAAKGTLARRIIDGAPSVRIFGEEIPVRAQIHTINGFSAHADQGELLAWHARVKGCTRTFLVHGEEPAMRQLANRLVGQSVEMPKLHESFDL
jgi:metallo-beta-lactamase family protein